MNIVILKFIGMMGPAVIYVSLTYKFLGKLNRKSCGWLLVGSLLANIIYGVQVFFFASIANSPLYTAGLFCGLIISIAASSALLHTFLRNEF